jgi:hypothetical protein
MGFDLPEEYTSNPKAILRKTRARLKKTPVVKTSGDSQAKRSIASEFEAMADKTLCEFSTPTTTNIHMGLAVNVGENRFELKPALITMVQASQFLKRLMKMQVHTYNTFLESCNTFTLKGVSRDATLLRLFPFSLLEKAK